MGQDNAPRRIFHPIRGLPRRDSTLIRRWGRSSAGDVDRAAEARVRGDLDDVSGTAVELHSGRSGAAFP